MGAVLFGEKIMKIKHVPNGTLLRVRAKGEIYTQDYVEDGILTVYFDFLLRQTVPEIQLMDESGGIHFLTEGRWEMKVQIGDRHQAELINGPLNLQDDPNFSMQYLESHGAFCCFTSCKTMRWISPNEIISCLPI